MRAVSIRQPWAWLIVNGHIDLMNLDWSTAYRGEILIRSGQKLVLRDYRELAAQLRDQLHIEVPPHSAVDVMPRGGIVGLAVVDGVVTEHTSPLFRGPFGWTFSHAQPLPFVPFNPQHRGPNLRWFDVPRALAGLAASPRERIAA